MIQTPIVILAGGLAKRIRPITDTIPKAMVSINGKPFIHWLIKYYINQGINDFHILLGYKGKLVENYVNIQKTYNVNLSLIHI